MRTEYNHSSTLVNNLGSLRINYRGYKVEPMKYGERLFKARKYAQLTQVELAARIDNVCTQENISKLERSDATGSEYTAQFANACGVNALWLAAEKGDMVGGYVVENPRIRHAAELMEPLPEYAIDHVIQEIAHLEKLIDKTRENKG